MVILGFAFTVMVWVVYLKFPSKRGEFKCATYPIVPFKTSRWWIYIPWKKTWHKTLDL